MLMSMPWLNNTLSDEVPSDRMDSLAVLVNAPGIVRSRNRPSQNELISYQVSNGEKRTDRVPNPSPSARINGRPDRTIGSPLIFILPPAGHLDDRVYHGWHLGAAAPYRNREGNLSRSRPQSSCGTAQLA